jgi:hypothetical protein
MTGKGLSGSESRRSSGLCPGRQIGAPAKRFLIAYDH